MADPLSIIASAITIAGTAANLSLALFKVAETFKNAPDEISEIANNISTLSNSLNGLVDVLQHCHQLCKPKLFEEIESIIQRYRKVEARLLDLTKPRKEKLQRLRWFFDAPKAKILLKKVESFKSALVLIIAVISLAKEEVKTQ